MAFLHRSFANEPSTSFNSLFRLLDDFDAYNNNSSSLSAHNNKSSHNGHHSIMRTFNPKFDVRELENVYELHGELPGIEQKDVEIEFIDAQTLSVKGRIERSHHSGTPPAAVEAPKAAGAIENSASKNAHKATVEDENAAPTSTEVTTTTDARNAVAETKQKEPEGKYWLSERSVGEFSRHFTFPVRVDQEGVTASMKNGVLSVTVPKAKKVEGRKITIS